MARDYIKVISPVEDDGSFCFWVPCRTGRLPREGKCVGPEYDCSFSFDIGYAWELKKKVEEHIGGPWTYKQSAYNLFRDFQEAFIKVIPGVFERHGFKPGQLTAYGYARRPSKGKWDFNLIGANIKIEENFILAKLMDKEMFEKEIWQDAVQLAIPFV